MIGVGLPATERALPDDERVPSPSAAPAIWLASLTRESGVEIGQVFSWSGLHSIAHQVATAAKPRPTGASSGASGNSGGLISIYGAVLIGAQAARQSISELLLILVSINIFVGMVNLFPMLPLDGGHVVIAVYERLRSTRRRHYHADVAKLMPLAYAFLAGIVLLGLLGALPQHLAPAVVARRLSVSLPFTCQKAQIVASTPRSLCAVS